jgi:ferritin-like metal-binding protein YciE
MISKTRFHTTRNPKQTRCEGHALHVRACKNIDDWPKTRAASRCSPGPASGIIKEAKEVAGDVPVEDEAVLDAALIAAAQAVEHYEIARYGSLIAWARALGRDDCANILQQNLAEQKAADKKLTEIAESTVNAQASAA